MSTEVVENFIIKGEKAFKEEKLKQDKKYMWDVVDGVKDKVIFPIAFSLFPSQSSSLKTSIYLSGW